MTQKWESLQGLVNTMQLMYRRVLPAVKLVIDHIQQEFKKIELDLGLMNYSLILINKVKSRKVRLDYLRDLKLVVPATKSLGQLNMVIPPNTIQPIQ